MNPTAKVNKVATQAVAKANPLEKLAAKAAASVNWATSPARVAIIVSTMVATVVLTAVLSTMGGISITHEYEFSNYIGYGNGN